MRNLRALSVLVMAMTGGLTGCFSTTRLVLKTQEPTVYQTATVEQVEQQMAERDAAIKTLNAQVLITATTGGGKEGKVKQYTSFKGYIFVQKPANLRVILQVPFLGSRALDMVSDGNTFTLMHATASQGDVWVQGTNRVTKPSKNGLENLRPAVFLDSLLLPGVRPGEFVTMTETSRVLHEDMHHKTETVEPDYELTVLHPTGGNILHLQRVIHINRVTMLPYQQDIYDDNGEIVTQATYDKYQMYGGQLFPAEITIRRPLDEYSLKINVTKLTLNEAFEADRFELTIPPGTMVQKLQ
jgi:outer membrane lipoprotein-sorting protein